MSAKNAGNQIISPRDQNIVVAQMHVKIVMHKAVTIVLWISHPMTFKKAGKREPALRPRIAAITLRKKEDKNIPNTITMERAKKIMAKTKVGIKPARKQLFILYLFNFL